TAYLKNPKWVKRGEEVFQTVIRDDPQNVDALLALARIYKGQGMRTRSISMFKKVLQAQPDNEEAKAEVPPEPSPEEPPPSGGCIKKLFGRGCPNPPGSPPAAAPLAGERSPTLRM